jgi:hypothetical protein
MLRPNELEEGSDAPSAEAVHAMFSVVQGTSPTDAWLEYLRARHPDAVDVLARAAMADMAIDLLDEHGDLTLEQALAERAEIAEATSRIVRAEGWREIREIAHILEELGEDAGRSDADVVDLTDPSRPERPRSNRGT